MEYVPRRTGGSVSWLTMPSAQSRVQAVLARVREIPPGFVRTYGDVSPGAPRFAGAVLHAADDPDLPWCRVVRADGSLAKGDRQRALLEAEGVPFRGSRVDMRVARLRGDVAPA
jgi:methylated-DNA-protein-cysteine methyltransferase related protein